MDIAFYLPGRIPVYTFSLLLAIGSLMGLLWAVYKASDDTMSTILDAGIWSLLGAVVGGRIAFTLIKWAYFQTHPLEIPQIWLGGISASGALAGGILTVLVTAAITHQNLGELADDLLPLLTALCVSAWLGCWVNGCVYGAEVQAWWGIPARDVWGDMATRWPIQPLGAIFTLLLFWGVDRARARGWLPVPGLGASLEVVGISLTGLGAFSLRVDSVPQSQAWPWWGFLSLAIISSTLLVCCHNNQKSNSDKKFTRGDSHL